MIAAPGAPAGAPTKAASRPTVDLEFLNSAAAHNSRAREIAAGRPDPVFEAGE